MALPPPGSDPVETIRAVCAHLAQKPAAAWVGMLDFVSFQGGTATFAPKRGCHEVMNFARGAMGNRLAEALSNQLGNKIQLAFLDRSLDQMAANAAPGTGASGNHGGPSSGNGGPTGGPNNPGSSGGTTSPGRPSSGAAAGAHSVARGLPLVRKVLETFPDAVMIDARKLPTVSTPPPPPVDSEDDDNADDIQDTPDDA